MRAALAGQAKLSNNALRAGVAREIRACLLWLCRRCARQLRYPETRQWVRRCSVQYPRFSCHYPSQLYASDGLLSRFWITGNWSMLGLTLSPCAIELAEDRLASAPVNGKTEAMIQLGAFLTFLMAPAIVAWQLYTWAHWRYWPRLQIRDAWHWLGGTAELSTSWTDVDKLIGQFFDSPLALVIFVVGAAALLVGFVRRS